MASQSQMSHMATGDNAEGTVLEDYITIDYEDEGGKKLVVSFYGPNADHSNYKVDQKTFSMIEEFMAKYSKTEDHHKYYTYALTNPGTCLFRYDRGNTEIKDPWVYGTSGKAQADPKKALWQSIPVIAYSLDDTQQKAQYYGTSHQFFLDYHASKRNFSKWRDDKKIFKFTDGTRILACSMPPTSEQLFPFDKYAKPVYDSDLVLKLSQDAEIHKSKLSHAPWK